MAALFKKKKDIVLSEPSKDHMLTCPRCGEEVVKSVVIKKKYICPKCNYYFRVRTKNRIRMVVDEDTFTPWCTELDTEEIGNPVYPPVRRKLAEHGIGCTGHAARQLTAGDYGCCDYLVGMDSANLRNMRRICGGDQSGKISLLLDWTDRPTGTTAKPGALLGRGGARERARNARQDVSRQSGLCDNEVADPWYTGDFEATWQDVLAGCRGLLDHIRREGN